MESAKRASILATIGELETKLAALRREVAAEGLQEERRWYVPVSFEVLAKDALVARAKAEAVISPTWVNTHLDKMTYRILDESIHPLSP